MGGLSGSRGGISGQKRVKEASRVFHAEWVAVSNKLLVDISAGPVVQPTSFGVLPCSAL
jgi:hypothetical protein